MTLSLIGLLALSLFASAEVRADEDADPNATPYRPTVSNPADLSAPGYLEAEIGAQRTFSANRSRADGVPYLLKYAFSENAGVVLGGNAFISQTDLAGLSLSGFGDTFVLVKLHHALNAASGIGIEFGPLMSTSKNGLGEHKTSFVTNGIYSSNFGALHLDLNAGMNYQGDEFPNTDHWQTTWAGALSRQFTERWGLAFEFSGSHQRGEPGVHQTLGAVNCNLSKRVVLDAGFAYALDRTAHDRTFFSGATLLLGKVR